MTLFYVLCGIAPVALVLASLVRSGSGSSVLEAMERSGVGTKEAAPIAPKIKHATDAEKQASVTPIGRTEAAEPNPAMAA